MIHFSKKYAYEGKVKKSAVYSEENMMKLKNAHHEIRNKTGLGNDMMGWIDYINLPETQEILEKMLALYRQWQEKKINTVIVSGIGGSALGARAAIHMCINKYIKGSIKVIWMDSISPSGNAELLRYLKSSRIKPAGIIITKSGKTLETLIGFRFIKAVLEYKYDEDIANKLAIITSDKRDNKLLNYAKSMKHPIFYIPKNIGGRFSTLTPAGLLPMIISGIDIFQVLQGAKDALNDTSISDVKKNTAYDFALHRYTYLQNGYVNEIVDSYEKKMSAFLEQYKQIFAESEAKNGIGLMPIPVTYTRDLHSLGQYLQDGPKTFFETTIWVRRSNGNAKIPGSIGYTSDIDYLTNVWLSEINKLAYKSVAEAHGKIAHNPVLMLEIDKMSPYDYGYMIIWLYISVTMSSYLMGVNPFTQPGVEEYKNILINKLESLKETFISRNQNNLQSEDEDENYEADQDKNEDDEKEDI